MLHMEMLADIDLLRDIDTDIVEKCMRTQQIIMQVHSKGKTIHNQGERCKTLDIVLSGRLSAYALFENGSAVTMFEFTKGSVIGANLLFGDNQAYPLNIYAMTDCALVHISSDAVLEFLRDYSFTLKFVKALSMNSQGMNKRLTMLTQRTLRENIVEYLKQQSALQKSATVILPISKKELADRLGVQRPSLFREFKRLQEDGLITITNRSICLVQSE